MLCARGGIQVEGTRAAAAPRDWGQVAQHAKQLLQSFFFFLLYKTTLRIHGLKTSGAMRIAAQKR